MSQNDLKAQKEWTDDNLATRFIRPSTSTAASPMLFVKKKKGSLRPCQDCRGLNKSTIKDRYHLPPIDETLTQLAKAQIVTKKNIRDAYNLIRIKGGDKWKKALQTQYGLFEFLVMPLGLTNAPATIQRYVNETLRPYLDQFCTAYLEDVLVHSENLEEHTTHVRLVLELLQKAGHQVKPQKCEFDKTTTEYLGVIITPNSLQMDLKKVDAVMEWPVPQKLRDV